MKSILVDLWVHFMNPGCSNRINKPTWPPSNPLSLHRSARIILLLIGLLLICSVPATAKQLTIEDLLAMSLEELINIEVRSVGFFKTSARKAPGYSFIITAEEIEKSPARTLSDIIEMKVPGMTAGGHERHGPIIGTRGIFIDNNAKTMVMLDEQQINQRSQFGYTSGLLSPLLGDLKQVEIVLGPGAILHGSGALNGFINLIPKNGEDNPGLFFDSEYGLAEKLWKFEAGYGASYGERKNIYFYGGLYGAEGYEPDELYGYSKTFDIHAKGFDNGNYRFSFYWNHEKFNLNTFFYENNPYKNSSVEIGNFHQTTLGMRPKYLFKINDTDSLEIIGSFLWFDHSDHRDLTGGGAENHWVSKNIYRTTRWKDHSLAVGFSVGEKRFHKDKQFFNSDPEYEFASLDTKWRETSVFGEDMIALTERWSASFGLRYDKIHLNDMTWQLWQVIHETDPGNPYKQPVKTPRSIEGHFSPRIATAYELDKNTTIKASYQHGFRTPDAAYYRINLMYNDAADSLGLYFPPLGIETLDSFELGFQKNFPGNKLRFDCNIFYNILEDLLSWTLYRDTGLYTPAQLDLLGNAADPNFPPNKQDIGSFLNELETIKIKGGEISVAFQPIKNNEVRLNYGYVHSNADQVRYPEHQIKVNTLSSFWNDKINFNLSYLFNSGYSESNLSRAHEIYRNDRHVMDMALNYNMNKNVTVGVIVNNLFENDVPPMVFTPDSPNWGGLGFDERRVYVSLKLNL